MYEGICPVIKRGNKCSGEMQILGMHDILNSRADHLLGRNADKITSRLVGENATALKIAHRNWNRRVVEHATKTLLAFAQRTFEAPARSDIRLEFTLLLPSEGGAALGASLRLPNASV